MEDISNEIILVAERLFMKLGIRSVTMDDVARELSMSKKTLYQYFDNKDSLVSAVGGMHLEKEKDAFDQISLLAQNAIEEIHNLSRCMRENIMKINPTTLNDLKKYHREGWNKYLEFKNEFIRGNVEKNIKRGIQEGYYRKEIDAEIMAICRVEQVQLLFDDKLFPPEKFDFIKVQLQIFDHFVQGLLTEKGRMLYHNYQKEEAKSSLT